MSDQLQLICGVLDKVSATLSQEGGSQLSGETVFIYYFCLLLYICPSELYQQEDDLQLREDVSNKWHVFNRHFLMAFGDFLFNQQLMYLAIISSGLLVP